MQQSEWRKLYVGRKENQNFHFDRCFGVYFGNDLQGKVEVVEAHNPNPNADCDQKRCHTRAVSTFNLLKCSLSIFCELSSIREGS